MLTRVRHWDTCAFHQFLIERAQAPFAWGGNDCALFAADGIEAMTGVDIAADFRGNYSDRDGAFALIGELTGGSSVAGAAAWCAAKHELPEWPNAKFAQRGDLVVFTNSTGELIAGLVHLSGRHIVAVGEEGLYRFPITAVERAWHV